MSGRAGAWVAVPVLEHAGRGLWRHCGVGGGHRVLSRVRHGPDPPQPVQGQHPVAVGRRDAGPSPWPGDQPWCRSGWSRRGASQLVWLGGPGVAGSRGFCGSAWWVAPAASTPSRPGVSFAPADRRQGDSSWEKPACAASGKHRGAEEGCRRRRTAWDSAVHRLRSARSRPRRCVPGLSAGTPVGGSGRCAGCAVRRGLLRGIANTSEDAGGVRCSSSCLLLLG